MKDFTNALKPQTSVHPQVISSNTTVDGDTVDLAQDEGYNRATAMIQITDLTDGTYAWELQESNDDSNWSAVADADLEGSEPSMTAAGNQKVGYLGDARYIRVSVTSTSVTTGASVVGMIVMHNANTEPVA